MKSRSLPAVAAGASLLMLAACTSGTASTESSSPAPVASASSGEVAGTAHPKSKCRSRDDDTANVKIVNELAVVPVDGKFRAVNVDPTTTNVVWLQQTGDKFWNSDDREGQWECAPPPMAVSNLGTYYYYSGDVWADHPGWWGHQEDVDWSEDPSGYVWWRCTTVPNRPDGGVSPGNWTTDCGDAALKSAEIKAPWDTRGNKDNNVNTRPDCEVRKSRVVGCWTNSYHNSGYDDDYVFDTFAWTAPMRLDVSSSWRMPNEIKVYASKAAVTDDSKSFKSEKPHLAWRVDEALLTQGAAWARLATPVGQVVAPGVGNTLRIGAYALADNAKTGLELTLSPIYFSSAEGVPYSCVKGETATQNACWPDPSLAGATTMSPESRALLDKSVSLRIAASITLENVRRNAGPPSIKREVRNGVSVELNPISCSSTSTSLANANLQIDCAASGGSAGSAVAYGSSWSATISNK